MARIKICKEVGCHDASTTAGYCRLHYLKRWKQIKGEERGVAAKRLNRYIEKICRENPDDYLDVIKRELSRADFEESSVAALDFGDDLNVPSGEQADDEEIERIIKKLKVEEGF
jgi:hypothetical protein